MSLRRPSGFLCTFLSADLKVFLGLMRMIGKRSFGKQRPIQSELSDNAGGLNWSVQHHLI